MKRPNRAVFAIVRVDEFQSSDAPWANRVNVKEIVWSEDQAKREVKRLSKINKDKRACYFWQMTRLLVDPSGGGD